MKTAKFVRTAILAGTTVASAGFATQASAEFVLPDTGYIQYGDGLSYSLPLLAYFYDQVNGGGVGPGNPYYIPSGPGQISSLVVVATGADGNPVETNYNYMDDAYPTPSGVSGSNFFSTGTTADPGTGPFQGINQSPTGDLAITWDADIAALNSFLGGEDMVFFFNNNQLNAIGEAAQSLAIWALISVTDATGATVGTFEFTNMYGAYAPFFEGGGGLANGDPTTYTTTKVLGVDGPTGDGTNAHTDYVLSGGALCLTSLGALKNCDGSTLSAGETIVENFAHNLGANQAAYAVIFPELNALIAGLDGGTMHIDVRMGCDPTLYGSDPNAVICAGSNGDPFVYGKNINNGYEQIFISTTSRVTIPEPATVALLGMGLLGLGLARRRRPAA